MGVDEQAAVRATVRGEAVPVLTSALALALGFAVLGLSNFRIIAEFGLLAAGTMVYASLSDLLLMPILLKRLRLATLWDMLNLEVDHAVLERCPLFAEMSQYQVKKLILLSDRVEFSPGQYLLRKGEVSSGMYVILKGKVVVEIETDGQSRDIDVGVPGDIFGEIGFAGTGGGADSLGAGKHGRDRRATRGQSRGAGAAFLSAHRDSAVPQHRQRTRCASARFAPAPVACRRQRRR